jgi:menaquinone-dependent protoporphyrinogen oxidase
MHPIIVLYATREGHTKRVAEYIVKASRSLSSPITVLDVNNLPNGLCLTAYAGVIIAASVHGGKHEPEIVNFVRSYRTDLNRMRTAFLSVSLSQAGAQDEHATPDSRARATADVKRMIDVFLTATQWHPTLIQPVAGALMYSRYNFLVRFIMKRIALRAGASSDTSRDQVFTRWHELDDLLPKLLSEETPSVNLGSQSIGSGQVA